MPLQKIDVLIADPNHPDDPDHATTHRVTVLHRDRLVAEQNAAANGIPVDGALPQAMTALILWNALRRIGVHNEAYQKFLPRMLDTDQVRDDDDVPPEEVGLADPTQQGPGTDSPSPSDSTGPASTGSTLSDPSPALTPTA